MQEVLCLPANMYFVMCFVRLKKIQQKKKKIKAKAEIENKLRLAKMEAEEGGRKGAGMKFSHNCLVLHGPGLYKCLTLRLLFIVISQVPRLYLMRKKMKIYCLNDYNISRVIGIVEVTKVYMIVC